MGKGQLEGLITVRTQKWTILEKKGQEHGGQQKKENECGNNYYFDHDCERDAPSKEVSCQAQITPHALCQDREKDNSHP